MGGARSGWPRQWRIRRIRFRRRLRRLWRRRFRRRRGLRRLVRTIYGKLLNQLVEKLAKGLWRRLVPVVLYGSPAAGRPPRQVLRLQHSVRITRNRAEGTGRRRGRSSAGGANRAARRRCCSPNRKWTTSTDCFAIEFHDIRQHHRILFGKDVVTPLVVDDSFYRAQVEHELRAKMLRLRQKASGMLSDADLLRRLLLDSFRHSASCSATR